MGKLLFVTDEHRQRSVTSAERHLDKLFWENARRDVDALLRLYLYKFYNAKVHPEFYTAELLTMREMQGFMPSTAKVDLKMAFDMAHMGGMKTVQTAMLKEKESWAAAAVSYGDESYLNAVVNAVTQDDSAAIKVLMDKWLGDPKLLKNMANMTKKRNTPTPVVRALTKGLQKVTNINGKTLRARVEAVSGLRIAVHTRDGKITEHKKADVLPFRKR